MKISPEPDYKYAVGGTLRVEDRTYVTRQADQDFYDGLKAGEFCYVLNSRQMGKSSLRVRTMARLKSEGIACAAIDITSIIGDDTTEEKWYAGIIRRLVISFDIGDDFNLVIWWQERNLLSCVQRFSEFIETVVLAQTDRYFVIFIDEIDSILKLEFSTDDFFAYIRSCWNDRADKPEYRRLTFAILGVAEPADLMRDRRRTPFNIGQAIELNGFSCEEAKPLVIGLATTAENPQLVLQEILNWTGGQPFLTQKVCQSIAQLELPIRAGSEIEVVSDTIRTHIIDNWEMHDKPEHLATIRNRIFESKEQHIGKLLRIYQQILVDGEIAPDNSRRQMELRLTGIVVKFDNKLKVYNRIYGEVFDRDWLDKALLDLRPYGESLNAWVISGETDQSRLLQGSALQQALNWSRDRNLGGEDYRFLNASQGFALAQEQQANQILTTAKQAAEDALTKAQTQLGSLQAQEEQAKQRLAKIERRTTIVSIVFGLVLSGTFLAVFWLKQANDRLNLATMRLAITDSKIALTNNRGLEAIVEGIRAGKKLLELDKSVDKKDDQFQSLQVLQQANYQVLEQNRLQGHSAGIISANFSPDGSKIVTTSFDKTASMWDVHGTLLATLTGHSKDVISANFSPDSSKIVTASVDKTARVWDLHGNLLATLTGHSAGVRSANFSPDGTKIVTASGDKTARMWDLQGNLLQTFTGHSDGVWSANFSPDGTKIVTAAWDKTARVWDLQGNLLTTIAGHAGAVRSANFSPDGTKIVTASVDKTARVWDLQGNLLTTIAGHVDAVRSANFSPDGTKIVTADRDKTVKVWNIRGYHLATLTGHSDEVWSANFSPDGSKIVTASLDETGRIWNVQGYLFPTFTGHSDEVWSANFSPDGSKIVTASVDKTAQVWDTRGYYLATLTGHSDEVWSGNFSPDGSKIVTASGDKTARLWDLQGNLLKTFTGHSGSVWSANFSPDGSKIVTASGDKTARLWDLQGNLRKRLTGHSGSIWSANFSPDGSKIVTASGDTAVVWTITGQHLATLTGHSSGVRSANFSPDGSKIVTGSSDKTARVWGRIDRLDTDLDRLLTRSCDKLHDYLATNPNVKPEDRELCGINTNARK